MCTLSIYTSAKHCFITMNRDELRTRDEPGVFNTQDIGLLPNELIYPIDADSKGTWIGVNNQGVALCLLNHYQGQQHKNMQSRGGIIPSALSQGSAESVEQFIKNIDPEIYNPFDLFLITQNYRMHFEWNGEAFKHRQLSLEPWYMFTSSSYLTNEVIAYRHSLFDAWSNKIGFEIAQPQAIIDGFHLIKTPSLESHSVLMGRPHSHTKSIVQIQLENDSIKVDYGRVDNESALKNSISQSLSPLES